MAGRFDKFTDGARRVLTLAQEESIRFRHNYINTEHLLLGLIREGEGVACTVLTNLGVPTGKVTAAVEFIMGPGEKSLPGQIGLTPRAKKVVELSVEEARRLNHSYIGTEHLLLGLIREGEGIAFGVLDSLGVSLDKVRQETQRVLASQSPPESSSPPMEPIHLPPPIEESKRASARSSIEAALHEIDVFRGPPAERDLLDALLRPFLTELMEAVDSLSEDIARYPEQQRRIEQALPTLANASSAALRHGHFSLGNSLTSAMVAVMDVTVR